MKHIRAILIAVLVFVFSMTAASPVLAQVNLPYTTDLLIYNQNTTLDVGSVTLNAYGIVTFQIDEAATDLRLADIRVYVGDEPPVKIQPEDYQYSLEGLGGVSSEAIFINILSADLNGDSIVYIAACAVMTNPTSVTTLGKKTSRIATETAQARGEEFTGGKGKNRVNFFALTITG